MTAGYFQDELAAARAYDFAATEIFGRFACLNLTTDSTGGSDE